ncbi:MAG TPA: type VI secretion system baseplate subunit TssG [Burkholderiaceae bacterium]|nr:type VI secretion system baseplate subunit TssG [Burkholderiaceae bacterium]
MQPSQRRHSARLIDRLFAAPERFRFFQAVRLLEAWWTKRGLRREAVLNERIRFRNSVSLSFPPSEIESLRETSASETEATSRVELTPSFMGLLGVRGTLPLHYTERIAHHEVFDRDRSARAFFDVLSNRSIALFYAAWRKYRLPLHDDFAQSRGFHKLVLALGGFDANGVASRKSEGPTNDTLAFYAALIRHRPVSSSVIQRVLADYFRVAVRVESFVGQWCVVPVEQRSRLGGGNAALGRTALVGERVWQRDLRLRLWIGPLSAERFTSFLPNGDAARSLVRMLALLTGASLEYEVRPMLEPQAVRGVSLTGVESTHANRLGWNAFLITQPAVAPRADARWHWHGEVESFSS